MTLTEGTSTEIAQHLDNDALRMRETYTAGTFGPELPPLPSMSTRSHVLFAVEGDLDTARIRLEHLGERGWVDILEELINEIHQRVAEEEA